MSFLDYFSIYYFVCVVLILCFLVPIVLNDWSDSATKRKFAGEDAALAAAYSGQDWPKSADYPYTRQGTTNYLRGCDAFQDAQIERETGSPPDWSEGEAA